MADAKQDKNKQKDITSEGTGFKTVMGGFDKNEVNLYINKLKRQMKEQQEELERRIANLQTNLEDAHKESAEAKTAAKNAATAAAVPPPKDNSAETNKIIDQLKAENEKNNSKIMELRKSVLDERRNVAKFDKECAMAKMSEKKVREEFEKLKAKYLDLKKKGGGGGGAVNAVTTTNAEEVLGEAEAYAKEIIAAAKSYADETVKAANKYKTDVESELKTRADTLNGIKKKLDDQIKKTNEEQAKSAARSKEITSKIGAVTALFDNFANQFNSVNSQINDVTGKIDTICKQFNESSGQITSAAKQITETTNQISSVSKQINETTSQIDTVSKQINETTSQIDTVSKQINETTSQIDSFTKTINETTDKINQASRAMNATTTKISETSKKMNETSGMISEASKKMNETTGQINEASKKMAETTSQINTASAQMSGFNDSLKSAKSGFENVTKLVDGTKLGVIGAKSEVDSAHKAASAQLEAADLSPIAKIGEEIAAAVGEIKAKLVLPTFDESKFSEARFNEIKKKFKVETTYENTGDAGDAGAAEDDEFEDSDIISSMQIDSPDTDTGDMSSDLSSAPVFEETKPAANKSASSDVSPAKKDKGDRPGLDADFEDFFAKPPKDDDLSGEMPLINMEGVGAIDDFSLDSSPDPVGSDFEITPNDLTKKADKGSDLGEDIFDIAINPSSTDDDTLANMMADAAAAEKAANKDFTPSDFNFDEDNTKPSSTSDDFGDFADLFAQGSTQTDISSAKKHEKPDFRKPPSDDPWSFGGDDGSDDSDLSSNTDISDLLI
ncbi:MAG: hypothetical protein K5876_07245 [Ruminiclostridium sp.]|nr:hypothetical protein [Ruminiclostridium sp.]